MHWWSLNASYFIFRTVVEGSKLGTEFSNTGLSWEAKLTSEIRLPYDVALQLNRNYTAPEVEAQCRDLALYHGDASLLRTFLYDRARVNITLRVVLITRRVAGENYASEFFQSYERQRASRIFLLNVRYRF